eukprot:jgi/Tetstr1/466764/TSEL_011234.t1
MEEVQSNEECNSQRDVQVNAWLKVGQWTSACLDTCVKKLTALNKPFKYVVTCVVMQKNGSRTVRWENKSMYCICTVFGLAI